MKLVSVLHVLNIIMQHLIPIISWILGGSRMLTCELAIENFICTRVHFWCHSCLKDVDMGN